MPKITVKRQRCKGCLLCISVCPKGQIVVEEHLNSLGVKPVRFKGGSDCIGCSMCALICPDCCIEVHS